MAAIRSLAYGRQQQLGLRAARKGILHTVENSEKLARYAAHHRPFYEQLLAQRMDVTPWE